MDGGGDKEGEHLLWVPDIMVQLRWTSWLTHQIKTPVLTGLRKGGSRNNCSLIPQLLQQPDGFTPDIQMKTTTIFSPWSSFPHPDQRTSAHTWILSQTSWSWYTEKLTNTMWAGFLVFELHNTDDDTTTPTQMGLLARKPESLYVSVHYSACLHHFRLVHKLPGYQEALMEVCLNPNQCTSVMMSVVMSFWALSSSFLQEVLNGNL